MRQHIITITALLMALLASPGVTLTSSPDVEGVRIVVRSDAPRHLTVQIDATAGLAAEPQLFELDLAAGESFGHLVHITARPGSHPSGESVRVRVWASDGGTGPAIDQTITIIAPTPARIYLPLI